MNQNADLRAFLNKPYAVGFKSSVKAEVAQAGLSEETITAISAKKNEPQWLLQWRLKAFRKWQTMLEPHWAELTYSPIDYQAISYFAQPKQHKLHSLDELDPEIKSTFDKLGIPLQEQELLAGVAVDAVFDSVSVATTFKQKLADLGIIFCPISEAVINHADLIKKYLGSVVPPTDNFFACLNSAVFTDGTFVYIPPNTHCPIELSTYFRINEPKTGQFERTLIIADKNSYISYLEGCSAPENKENQLHAAVVELVAHENAEIKYSTVQNWYAGDKNGNGGIYNFVTKRALAEGNHSRISWTQLETGSSITWKYPSVILKGDHSSGQFYSVALTNNQQQADTGTKMIHIGKHTKSNIVSKGISSGNSTNTYRGKVHIAKNADFARNITVCDSLILSHTSRAITLPTIINHSQTSTTEHEAQVSNVSKYILQYCKQRGLSQEEAHSLFINGFCKEVIKKLPLEFAVEAQKLIEINLENTIG